MKTGYAGLRRTRIQLDGPADLVGREIQLKDGRKTRATGRFEDDGGRAHAELELPMPEAGRSWGEMEARIAGFPSVPVSFPDAMAERARVLLFAPIVFRPYCFEGTEFPQCDFEQPVHMEQNVLGPYEIKTTFYDKDFNEVTEAKEPGRYGAVVDIIPETGRPLRRLRTLYRQPGEVEWWRADLGGSVELPEGLGVSAEVVEKYSKAVGEVLTRALATSLGGQSRGAALVAGLSEATADGEEVRAYNDVWALDRQWWVTLKRKISGAGNEHPNPFVAPRRKEGLLAPVVHEGSLSDAGITKAGVAAIDAVCREWAADTDEGFGVCIVRHGVIALHKAYGERDGRAMSLTDKSRMASITKLLSASLMMMMLVDQGLVDLDATIDTYLPTFRGVEMETPLTVRHLYTHTNGLSDLGGDSMHDLDHTTAEFSPHLEVGKRYQYNGVGYAIGGKIIEAISGEGIPQFYQNHLLRPLGCDDTWVTGTASGAESTALDIAKVGQMLLSQGAYGDLRFFGEETAAKQRPTTLTVVLGPGTKTVWGIGTMRFKGEGFGEGTFAHGAASKATFRIDPVNDLVVVMTRNTAGKNFDKYHPRFLEAVVAALPKHEPQGK